MREQKFMRVNASDSIQLRRDMDALVGRRDAFSRPGPENVAPGSFTAVKIGRAIDLSSEMLYGLELALVLLDCETQTDTLRPAEAT